MFALPAGMPADAIETTIAVALYVSPLSHKTWRRMGPAGVAAYTAGLLVRPEFRFAELVAYVSGAERAGTLPDAARLVVARRFARRVVAGPAGR